MERIELDALTKANVALHRVYAAHLQVVGGLLEGLLNRIGEQAGWKGTFWLSEDGSCLETPDAPAPPEAPPAQADPAKDQSTTGVV